MAELLNCVLLVDDNPADNYLHELVIQEAGVAEKIVITEDGEQALEYLKQTVDGQYPQPDLVFLDINMPRMTGWEFLEAYNDLPAEQRGKVVIVMLTTSKNPDDLERANQLKAIGGFENKPLTHKRLINLLSHYFPDRVSD